jgi:hypothetical protein
VGPQNPKTPICLIKTIIKNKKLRWYFWTS